MATTKYDLLKALIEAQGQEPADEAGWHYLLMGVCTALDRGMGAKRRCLRSFSTSLLRPRCPRPMKRKPMPRAFFAPLRCQSARGV